MSAKEERPTLAGAQIKTRKRNIAVPLDPGSFADAVVTIFEDAKEGTELDKNLHSAVKGLETAELDFSRYGDTLFEVLFAGGRMAAGGNVVEDGKKLDTCVMSAEPNKESITPYVKVFQTLIRRRPFLIKALEHTLEKLLKSIDFYDDVTRTKIAIATARIFALKVGVLPEKVLMALLNDRLVAKGNVLQLLTDFFKDFVATESTDELMALLKKAKLDERLLDFFPPTKRTEKALEEHFQAAGLPGVVEYNRKKLNEKHLQELQTALTEMIGADPPAPVADCIALVKQRKTDFGLPETELLKVLWTCFIGAVPTTGKNQQQITLAIMKQTKSYGKLLSDFCGSARLEAALMQSVQLTCYEDTKLLKVFKDIIRILYDADIIAEDTIFFWYKKGAHPKGKTVFQKDMEPFIKWLDEADEEEAEEDE